MLGIKPTEIFSSFFARFLFLLARLRPVSSRVAAPITRPAVLLSVLLFLPFKLLFQAFRGKRGLLANIFRGRLANFFWVA